MHSNKKKCVNILFLALVLVFGVNVASAQNDDRNNSIINNSFRNDIWGRSRQININRSGNYRLRRNLNVRNGDGIVISASNVTLDLNGHTVTTRSEGTGRGIAINGVKGVKVINGKVSGFNQNISVANSENVNISNLQIVGKGLAPNNGPTEIGVLLVQSRSIFIYKNNISSVNLGVFVRGGQSTGNRIFENVIVGGANPANNLLGICYNPAADAGDAGPRGDNIYNNHVTRFGFAFSISTNSLYNVFNENISASFNGIFANEDILTDNGGTNVSEGNISVTIPSEVLQ